MPWKAHHDSISCVTYISELNLLASSSYDQHVFIWDVQGDKMEQVGSLLLGKKPIPQGMDKSQVQDPDQRTYIENWKVVVDKMKRYRQELEEAREMLAEVEEINYDEMRAQCQAKKGGNPVVESPGRKRLSSKKKRTKKAAVEGQEEEHKEGELDGAAQGKSGNMVEDRDI